MLSEIVRWLGANSAMLNGAGAIGTMAAALAAWWAARATALSVAEMRAARLQSCRPHLALELGPTVIAALSAEGVAALPDDWIAIRLRNEGFGPARRMWTRLCFDARPNLQSLLSFGAITKAGPGDKSPAAYRIKSIGDSRRPDLPFDAANTDIALWDAGLSRATDAFIGDLQPLEAAPQALDIDELLAIATMAMSPLPSLLTRKTLVRSALLQAICSSAAGEVIIQEYWIAVDLALQTRGLQVTLRHAAIYAGEAAARALLRKRRREARRLLRGESQSWQAASWR